MKGSKWRTLRARTFAELARTPMLVAALTATVIAAASAAAAFGTLLAYVWFARRGEMNAAREEALALAETRGEIVIELQTQLRRLHDRHREASDRYERRIQELEDALGLSRTEAREHAYQMQRFYVIALVDFLRDVRGDLERLPPDVDAALARIREVVPDGQSAA